MNFTNEKIFARGITFYKVFIFFVLGSLIGSFYEEILFFIQTKEWTGRHDLIYVPFSTLYGFGTALFLVLLGPKNEKRGWIKTFFLASFIGGVTEYVTGLLCELFLKIQFWDYSHDFLNIGGKTTIPYALIWGLFATLFLKLLYPKVSNWIERIPVKIGEFVCFIGVILMSLNLLISYTAFFRMLERNKGREPKTFVGAFYDKVYSDDFMYQKFPILKGKINHV